MPNGQAIHSRPSFWCSKQHIIRGGQHTDCYGTIIPVCVQDSVARTFSGSLSTHGPDKESSGMVCTRLTRKIIYIYIMNQIDNNKHNSPSDRRNEHERFWNQSAETINASKIHPETKQHKTHRDFGWNCCKCCLHWGQLFFLKSDTFFGTAMAAICHDSHAAQALRALQRPSRPNSEGISWGIIKTENNEFLKFFGKTSFSTWMGGMIIFTYHHIFTFWPLILKKFMEFLFLLEFLQQTLNPPW